MAAVRMWCTHLAALVVGVLFTATVLRFYRTEPDLRVLAFLLLMGTSVGISLVTVRHAWRFRLVCIMAVAAGSLLERWAA